MVADLFLYSGYQMIYYDLKKTIFTNGNTWNDRVAGDGSEEF